MTHTAHTHTAAAASHPTSLSRRRLLGHGAALAAAPALMLAGGSAHADLWPNRALRIIVGFAGGSSPDLTARLFTEPMTQLIGRPVVVENKVGAAGNVAAAEVARATDDHTIGLMINGNMTVAKILNPATPYDPLTDLHPLSLVGVSPLVLVAPTRGIDLPPDADAATVLEIARKTGNTWNYGSPGIGTIGHLGMELIKARNRIAPEHVPYSSYTQVALALGRGELQLALLPPALATAQAAAGHVRLLGITTPFHSLLVPNVPSLPGIDLQVWNAFAAPKSMPAPLRSRLSTKLVRVARMPEIREKLFAQGWQVVAASPEGLANRIQRDTQELSALIRERGIRVN